MHLYVYIYLLTHITHNSLSTHRLSRPKAKLGPEGGVETRASKVRVSTPPEGRNRSM